MLHPARAFPILLALAALGWTQDPAVPPIPTDSLPAELSLERPYGLDRAGKHTGQDPALVALGRRLFFDPILSSDRTVACASCHQPDHGFADPRPFSIGIGGQLSERHSPTLLNRSLGESFMWDGRADSLEAQVVMPIANPIEMGLGIERALKRLAADEAYKRDFLSATGEEPSRRNVSAALASFVRVLHQGDSPVDRFRSGGSKHLSEPERAGLWLYESRGQCWRCHSGPNFSDEQFHNTGIGVLEGGAEEGRFAVTGEADDRGAFKTPTLRGLEFTAPYMHDGSLATLEEVVRFYRDGGHPNPELDRHMGPVELSDRDVDNLVAFLKALSRQAEGPPPVDEKRD